MVSWSKTEAHIYLVVPLGTAMPSTCLPSGWDSGAQSHQPWWGSTYSEKMAYGTLLTWQFRALEMQGIIFNIYFPSGECGNRSVIIAWLILISVYQQPVFYPFWQNPESLFPELYQMYFLRVNNLLSFTFLIPACCRIKKNVSRYLC